MLISLTKKLADALKIKVYEVVPLRRNPLYEWHANLFVFNRPMAGPVAFIKLNIAMPIAEFCDALVKEKGVVGLACFRVPCCTV